MPKIIGKRGQNDASAKHFTGNKNKPAIQFFDYRPLHLWEQYLTCSQTVSHFFRQVKGLPQRSQILVGRFSFLIPLGINGAISQRGRLFGQAPVFKETLEISCIWNLYELFVFYALNCCDEF